MLQSKTIKAAIAVLVTGFAGAHAVAAPIVLDIGAGAGNATNVAGTTTVGPIAYNTVWVGSVANLVDTDGTATPYGFSWVDYSGVAWLSSVGSDITGDAAALFPQGAAKSFFGGPTALTYKFTGLDTATQYKFTFYSSDVTTFTVTGANVVTGSLTTSSNLSEVLTLSGITPTAAGEISIAYVGLANAVQMDAVVPEPASLGLLGLSGLALLRRRK